MKRTAEFVLGLIGAIIGLCISLFGFVLTFLFFVENEDEVAWAALILSLIFFIVQVAALILSCTVHKINHKWYGGLMIFFGVVSFPASIFVMFVPSVLYFISGALAFRSDPEIHHP